MFQRLFGKKEEAQAYGSGEGKKIGLVNVDLRDGQQSLLATRIRTEEVVPILGKMDQVGYEAIECWGGATFDACIRFVFMIPGSVFVLIKLHLRKLLCVCCCVDRTW